MNKFISFFYCFAFYFIAITNSIAMALDYVNHSKWYIFLMPILSIAFGVLMILSKQKLERESLR